MTPYGILVSRLPSNSVLPNWVSGWGPSLYYVSTFLDFFWPTHPTSAYLTSSERQQNWYFSDPTQSLYCRNLGMVPCKHLQLRGDKRWRNTRIQFLPQSASLNRTGIHIYSGIHGSVNQIWIRFIVNCNQGYIADIQFTTPTNCPKDPKRTPHRPPNGFPKDLDKLQLDPLTNHKQEPMCLPTNPK